MLYLLCVSFFQMPYAPLLELDDERVTASGHMLSAPCAVLYHQDRLYVADSGSHQVFMLDNQDNYTVFGKPGNGPREFKNPPVRLEIEDGHLRVTEWNRWSTSLYTLDGNFVKKFAPNRYVFIHNGVVALKHYGKGAMETGYLFQLKDKQCYFGKLREKTWLEYHLSTNYHTVGEDGQFVIARKSGLIETYDGDCKQVASMVLMLDAYKREMVEDRLSTGLSRRKGKKAATSVPSPKAYRYGVPIIAVAAKNASRVWLLVKNENNESECFLYEVDPTAGEVHFSHKLDTAFDGLSYNGGKLILLSTDEALVRVYEIGA